MSHSSIISPPLQRKDHGHTQQVAGRPTADIDVLIVGDRRAAAPGICTTKGRRGRIQIIGAVESCDAALRAAREHTPRVCMISSTVDTGEWLSLVRRLRLLDNPPRVLIYGDPDCRMTGAAVLANVDGVLCRYGDPEELGDLVARLAAGEKVYPDLASDELHDLLDCVDDRDRAIMAMLLGRDPPDYIASTLGLSALALRLRRQAILTALAERIGEMQRRAALGQ